MTEYRLVPVEALEDVMRVARAFSPENPGAKTIADILAAPPAPTREEIKALLDKNLYAEAESDGVAWVGVRGIREAADAILALLGRQS